MQYLVRKAVTGSQSEFQDLDFEGTELTIGVSSSNHVSLSAGFDGNIAIKGKSETASYRYDGKTHTLDGKKKKSGKLTVGGTLSIGGYVLELIEAPLGFDLAVQLTTSTENPVALLRPKQALSLEETGFSVRRWGLIACFIVLLLTLLIPVAGLFDNNLAEKLRQLPIPSDNSWSSGPLIPAHRIPAIGDNCQTCHVTPFSVVADEQCLDCHRKLTNHIDTSVHAIHDFEEFRCGSCHREHNEPARIVRTDDKLCVNCHDKISSFDTQPAVPVKNVNTFTKGGHPEFRLSLLESKGKGGALGWETRRPSAGGAKAIEQSNLKFPHDLHLDDDKVQSESTGLGLECSNCHQLQDDEEHFAPVTMDKDCRSCHSLTFDVFNPDLELPHGDQRAAIVAMEAHFIREFTDPVLRKQRASIKPRRVPGKRTGEAACQSTGLECGRAEAAKESEYQFVKTGCITCHVVNDTGAANIIDRWYIQPININNDWYSKADYDHQSHLALAAENEQAVCESCHQVSMSSEASDISIPGIDNCLQCHDSDHSETVGLNCMSCHAYHLPSTSLMSLPSSVSLKAAPSE